jgi:lipopolysaccharide export LptBFGC system permease protein LptF
LSAGILTSLLLYGNVIRNEDLLVRALSISPSHFFELFFFLFPYAFSMALPFGFVVSVVFLIGKWVADGEILAYRSLGGDVLALLWVVMLFGTLISVISTYSSLEWSPVNRSKFDQLKREILWTQTNLLLEERGEIGFAFHSDEQSKTSEKLNALAGERIRGASLSVFDASDDLWKNLRIVLSGGPKEEVLVVIHARKAFVEKRKDKGELVLDLLDVDLEYGFSTGEKAAGGQFLSFERWKEPIVFQINQEAQQKGVKRMGFTELLSAIERSEDRQFRNEGISLLSKNLSFGTSPFFLGILLVPIGILGGKSEPLIKLSLGLAIGLGFYAMGLLLSGLMGKLDLGFAGWWAPNIVCVLLGMILMIRINGNR